MSTTNSPTNPVRSRLNHEKVITKEEEQVEKDYLDIQTESSDTYYRKKDIAERYFEINQEMDMETFIALEERNVEFHLNKFVEQFNALVERNKIGELLYNLMVNDHMEHQKVIQEEHHNMLKQFQQFNGAENSATDTTNPSLKITNRP